MGNISSNDGNNYIDNNGNAIQTPLNKFIEKVMNEDYFFTPNVSDNMINEVDKNDINNKKVLLKRALCTGTTYVPISLPYVLCGNNGVSCTEGIYTLKINATDENGKKLPNIENIKGSRYNKANGIAAKIINKRSTITEENIKEDTLDNIDARTVLEYLKIQNSFKENTPGETLTYSTYVNTDKSNARVGNTNGCKLFYIGKTDDDIKYEKNKGYNDFDINNSLLSTSKGFCGKVFQYNNLVKKINGVDDIIGENTPTGGSTYRQNEFIDCNCLNSEFTVAYTSNIYKKQEIADIVGQLNPFDIYIHPQEATQNNIVMCKNKLHDGVGAYGASNRKRETNLSICQSIKYLGSVDVGSKSIVNLVQNCNMPSGKNTLSFDDTNTETGNNNTSISTSFYGKNDEKNDNDKKNDKITMIIIIVLAVIILLIIIGIIILVVINKNKSNGTNETSAGIETNTSSNIESKYVRPASDPLYRVINY